MKTITLSALRKQAQQRADMEDTSFVSDAEWNTYINRGIQKLHNILVGEFAEDYLIKSDTIDITPGTNEYDLFDDFYKLRGVETVEGTNTIRTLYRFNWAERNIYNNVYSTYDFLAADRYRIVGDKLVFTSVPSGTTIKVWYNPTTTDLSNDTDTFDGINGFDEYVVLDAARKATLKEESFQLSDRLAAEQQVMEKMVKDFASNRDSNEPARIQRRRRLKRNYIYN